jgi:cysteine desulfurase family protein (TIGR01976 family)
MLFDESSEATGRKSDVARVRAQFPSLARGSVRLDGPGSSETPRIVVDAVANYLRAANANGHAGYAESQRSDATADRARAAAASLLGASVDEICFGLNATSLNYALSRTVARDLQSGDEIIVTRLDHLANVAPWKALEQDLGLVVRLVDIRDDSSLDLDDLRATINERTRIIAFPWASNAVGTHTDVALVSRLAHEAGALAWVDATHFVPHGPIDVAAVEADVAFCSAYKFFGPHLGVGFVRRELLERMRPYGFSDAAGTGAALETGTLPYAALAGLTAAVASFATPSMARPSVSTRRSGATGSSPSTTSSSKQSSTTSRRRWLRGAQQRAGLRAPCRRRGHGDSLRAALSEREPVVIRSRHAMTAGMKFETPDKTVLITVEQATALVSPAYDGGATGDEVAAKWKAHAKAPIENRRTAAAR